MRQSVFSRYSIFLMFAALLLAFTWSTQLASQELLGPSTSPVQERAIELPDPLTTEAANALMSRLSDSEVRQLLLDQLNTQAAQTSSETQESDVLHHMTTGAVNSIALAISRLDILYELQIVAFSNFFEKVGGWFGLGELVLFLALVIAIGLAAEKLFGLVTRSWHRLPPPDPNRNLRDTLLILAKRLVSDVLGVVVFLVVSREVARFILPDELAPFFRLFMIYIIGLPRLSWAFGRFLAAPHNPAYRIVHVDDASARKILRGQTVVVLLIGFSFLFPQFNALNDVPVGQTRLGFWLSLIAHFSFIVWIWINRKPLRLMMRGADPEVSPVEARFAQIYPTLGIVMVIMVWWTVNTIASLGNFALLFRGPHFITIFLLLYAPAFDTGIRGLVKHIVPPMSGEGPIAERAYVSAKRSFIRIGRVIVFSCVLFIIATVWGISPASIIDENGGAIARVFAALLTAATGYLIYEVVSLWINRKLAAEQTAAGYNPDEEEIGGEGGGAGGSRLSTVLPLILGVARVAIIMVFALIALSDLGIDTTPLLAGAGIVGLAIGFGAQKLVTDVVSGIFFLIDDAFRTGEYVEVDGTMGTVEKISIRSMQLRHHKGPVHTLPYGEIPKITNYSRDWVIMKLRFTVPFGTDPNKVKKIFKRIGAEMLEDELFKDDFLQPFKSQGVLEFDDVGMVIRGKFMAKPGTQFTIRKEIFNRVNKAFEENGIDFARREVRVALPGLEEDQRLTDEDKATIAAAASQAAQDMVDTAPSAPKPGD